MTGVDFETSQETVLAVFEGMADPSEPLTTKEVAARLGWSYRRAYDQLTDLAERGEIRSKTIGPRARAWWRPGSGPSTGSERSDDGSWPNSSATEKHPIVERFLEAVPVSVVIVESTGEISFANRRAAVMLGLDREVIERRTYRDAQWKIYAEDGTPIPSEEHPVTQVLETGRSVFGFEHWIEHPDGSERWLSSNSSPVLADDGTVEYVVVGFEDATPLKEREDKLTSEQRRWVELRSDRLFRAYLEAADGAVRVDVEEIVRQPDETTLQYLSATSITARALVEVLEREPDVLDVRLLRSTADQCRVEVHRGSQTLPVVFEDLGGRVTSLVRTDTDGSAVLVGELPGDVDVRTLIRNARRIAPDVELGSQGLRYSPRLLYDIVEDVLTDRQFAALQAAYTAGYFESPRTSTGDELADQLGVTRQTFNQHLRRAELIVFHTLFEASGKAAR